MSDEDDTTQTERRQDERGDDAVARLLHLAGPRPAIPRDLEQRVQARVRQEWRQATARRSVVRWTVPLALAAGVLLLVSIDLRPPAPLTPAPVLGTVARVEPGSDAGMNMPAVGDGIRRGETIATGSGQSISVLMRDGVSLRLAPASRLRLDGSDEFTLQAGELYADTRQPIYRSATLTVHTPLATVTDVGTQFSVRYVDDSLRVAVREGRVDVARDSATHTAVAGELLRLRPGEVPRREVVAPHDELWAWTTAIAPVFDIENRSLMEFLQWAARETGRELTFAGDEQRMAAMRAVQHGSIAGFTPEEAIASLLAASGVEYRLTEDRIVIGAVGED